jgi:hypothetical protein
MNREFDVITSPESIFNPRTFKFCHFWTDILFSTALGLPLWAAVTGTFASNKSGVKWCGVPM